MERVVAVVVVECVCVCMHVVMKRRLVGKIVAPDGWAAWDQRQMLVQVGGAGGGLEELIAPWDGRRGTFTCYYGNNGCKDETVYACASLCVCACVVHIHFKGRHFLSNINTEKTAQAKEKY